LPEAQPLIELFVDLTEAQRPTTSNQVIR